MAHCQINTDLFFPQNFSNMDFSMSVSSRHSMDFSIKAEPMDFDTNSPYSNHNRNSDDPLNVFGPQVKNKHEFS
jgi:hypothetical protein